MIRAPTPPAVVLLPSGAKKEAMWHVNAQAAAVVSQSAGQVVVGGHCSDSICAGHPPLRATDDLSYVALVVLTIHHEGPRSRMKGL